MTNTYAINRTIRHQSKYCPQSPKPHRGLRRHLRDNDTDTILLISVALKGGEGTESDQTVIVT